jgi:hypothetical protein
MLLLDASSAIQQQFLKLCVGLERSYPRRHLVLCLIDTSIDVTASCKKKLQVWVMLIV